MMDALKTKLYTYIQMSVCVSPCPCPCPCVQVCVCLCTYVCVRVRVHVDFCVRIYVYMYVCINVSVCVCPCTCVCVCVLPHQRWKIYTPSDIHKWILHCNLCAELCPSLPRLSVDRSICGESTILSRKATTHQESLTEYDQIAHLPSLHL